MATLGYDPDPDNIDDMAAYCINEYRRLLAHGDSEEDAAAYADYLMRDWCRRHRDKVYLHGEALEAAFAAAR